MKNTNILDYQKALAIVVIAFIFLFTIPGFVLAQNEDYAWILVDEVDDRGIEDLEKIEAKLDKYEKSGIESSVNNTGYFVDYAVKKTFAGMNSSAQATISTTPLEIKPDTNVPLNLRLSVTENEGYNGGVGDASANASVMFCGNNSTAQNFVAPVLGGKPFYDNEFKSESRESLFSSNNVNGYPVYNTTVFASLPAGTVEGEAIAICANVSLVGVSMGTTYHYRWLPSGSGEVSNINEKYEVPKDDNGDYIDNGVRVSDIAGEVYIRRGDASAVEWEILNLDDVIYEGDMIHTKDRNSRCSLSLTDMTTFEMRPRSALIIITRSEKESALSLLAGKVMVNLKKMIKDGSMNVEMSQGIAGARGTIFSLESDEKTSRVAVLEGRVEVKDKKGGSIMLSPNEKITVTDGKAGDKETFSLKDELNLWEEETRNKILSDIEARTGQAPDSEAVPTPTASVSAVESSGDVPSKKHFPSYFYLAIIAVLFLSGIGYWFKKR